MKSEITPPYRKPVMKIVEIVRTSALLQTSSGSGQGNLPPTSSNNSDYDW